MPRDRERRSRTGHDDLHGNVSDQAILNEFY